MDDEGERARLHAEQDPESPRSGRPADEHGVPTVEPDGEMLAPALPEPRAEPIVHPDVPVQRTSR